MVLVSNNSTFNVLTPRSKYKINDLFSELHRNIQKVTTVEPSVALFHHLFILTVIRDLHDLNASSLVSLVTVVWFKLLLGWVWCSTVCQPIINLHNCTVLCIMGDIIFCFFSFTTVCQIFISKYI